MTYAQIQKQYYCGVDLHARKMFLCVMNPAGNILLHQEIDNKPKNLFRLLSPYLPSIAVGVESTFNWYWLADACKKENIPFYLGHALYMKAIHGGKKKNDQVDSKTIADLLRCNLFPLAYAYPQAMRTARDLFRRRHTFVVQRAGLYAHIQNTFSQYGVLHIAHVDLVRKSTRASLPDSLQNPDAAFSLARNLEAIEALDQIIYKLEKESLKQALHHDSHALRLLQTIPGTKNIVPLTLLYEIHTIDRFPSPQAFSSYARVVRVERSSAGKNTGGRNHKIGNPYLKWALGDIISHAQMVSPPLRKLYEKLKSRHGLGKARAIIAHKFAVAIYYMLKNGKAFDENLFVR